MKKNIVVYIIYLLGLSLFITSSFAANKNNIYRKHFYAGLSAGYGDTTWSELICQPDDVACNMSATTPTAVKEGGFVGGLQIGYAATPHFALQFQYQRYTDAKYTLQQGNPYNTPDYLPITVTSNTAVYALVGKFFISLFQAIPVRVYSDFGPALVTRDDKFAQTKSRLGVSFGGGVNYLVTKQFMVEAGFDYTTGYGKSESKPVYDYIPFTYDGVLRVSYLF